MILPHAFSDTSSIVEAWPWDNGGKTVDDIQSVDLTKEVRAHLSGWHVDTHFTSWAADFSTAISYAGTSNSAMIAVLDTAYCSPKTAVYHVPALYAAGIADYPYSEEYLVYGPVLGAAYCCSVSIRDIRKAGSTPYGFNFSTNTSGDITTKDLECAKEVASLFQHEVFEVAGPDLFLTVFAAELSRQRLPSTSYDPAGSVSWSLGDTQTIIRYLSDRTEDAAFCNIHPLVNPKTYVEQFLKLRGMVNLLTALNLEISKIRSEWTNKMRPHVDLKMMQETPRPSLKRKNRQSAAFTGSTVKGPKTAVEDNLGDKYGLKPSDDVAGAAVCTKPRQSKRARPTTTRAATRPRGQSSAKPSKQPVYDHPEPFYIAGKKEWKIDCFLASRVKDGQLQYQVQWQGWEPDPKFYPAANFKGTPNLLKIFHDAHPKSDGPPMLLQKWIKAWESGGRAHSHPDDNKVSSEKKTTKT